MMEGVNALIAFSVHFVGHFTGSILEEVVERRTNNQDGAEGRYILLETSEDLESDFVEFDQTDSVYEEYLSPSPTNDRFAWKQARPSAFMSLVQSIITVSGLSLAGGMVLGAFSLFLSVLAINTFDLCHWKDSQDKTLSRRVKNIRFAFFSLITVIIYSYQAILFVFVFSWSLVKEQNLFIVSLSAAFLDVFYRLLLKVFNMYTYKSFVLPYPQNVLFAAVCLSSGFRIARIKFPSSRTKSFKLCLRLCAQFLLGAPLVYIGLYFVLPAYANKLHWFSRFLATGVTGLVIVLLKSLTRSFVLQLEGVCHPGNSYILVVAIYGGASIILRVMQAELENLRLFCLMGIAHGMVFVTERAAVPFIDYLFKRLYKCCFKSRNTNFASVHRHKTPSSQRLIADVSIQTMIFEGTALVISVGVMQFYKLSYAQLTKEEKEELLIEFLKFALSGLVIEWFFNIVAVLLQTRYMNIAIFSVWKLKWRSHLLVGAVTSSLTVVCFMQYLLNIVRLQYKRDVLEWQQFSDNCTMLPFSNF